jgi:hypothetical protein
MLYRERLSVQALQPRPTMEDISSECDVLFYQKFLQFIYSL